MYTETSFEEILMIVVSSFMGREIPYGWNLSIKNSMKGHRSQR